MKAMRMWMRFWKGEKEMRSFLIKASIYLAIFIMMVSISICDNEGLPLWVPLVGILAPATYVFIISELEVF